MPALPQDWRAMLEGVEAMLAGALKTAEAREQALATAESAASPELTGRLTKLAEHVQGLAERAERARATVAEADAALSGCEEALRAWAAQAAQVRPKLAEWEGGA